MEKFQCKSKRVISIGEQQVGSDLFMVIDFALNDTLPNLNAVQYSDSFLFDIAEKTNDYAGIPLKVDLKKLLNGNTTNLTHNFSSETGRFYNQMIGSFVKFYTIGEGTDLELCGTVRIPKEFDQVCEVIQELYDSNALFVSYEILVGKYTTKNNGEVKYVDKDPENYLAAYSIVSQPAVVSAKALKLVAEIIEKGGETILTKTKYTQEQFIADFKKNLAIKEIAELNYNQVMMNLYAQLKDALGDNYYDFYICDNGVDFLIMESCADGSLVRIDFSVDGDTVVILDCYPVTRDYNPINNNQNNEGGNGSMKTAEQLQAELAEVNASLKIKEVEFASKEKELNATIEANKTELASIKEKLTAKEVEVTEVNTKLETLSASVIEKTKEIADFQPIKLAYETAEATKVADKLVADKLALKEKFGKLLSAEVMTEMAEALESLDIAKLNEKVVEVAMSTAVVVKPTPLTATRVIDSVVIGKGLDNLSKYVTVSNN